MPSSSVLFDSLNADKMCVVFVHREILLLPTGGEESTIEFMESESVIDSKTPLLNDAYAYGVVEHPFPLNCFLRDWYLGPNFYHAVKIGIVQYVCALFLLEFTSSSFVFRNHCSYLMFTEICFADDTEDNMCNYSNDSSEFWGLWGREV